MGTPRLQYIADQNKKKTGIVLSLGRYQKLIEDLHDLAVVAERRIEESVISHDLKHRLERDGVLYSPGQALGRGGPARPPQALLSNKSGSR